MSRGGCQLANCNILLVYNVNFPKSKINEQIYKYIALKIANFALKSKHLISEINVREETENFSARNLNVCNLGDFTFSAHL